MHFEPQGVYSTGTFCSIFLFLGTGDSVFVVASIRDAVAAHVLPEIAGLSTPDQAWWLCLLLVVQSTVGTVYSGFFTCSAVARRTRQHAPAVTATIPTRYLPLGAEAPLTGRVVMDPMIWGVSLPCTVWQCGKADNAPYTPRRCRGRRSSLPLPAQPLYSLHQRWPCRACTRMVQLKALTNTPRKHHFVCIACVRHRCVRYL